MKKESVLVVLVGVVNRENLMSLGWRSPISEMREILIEIRVWDVVRLVAKVSLHFASRGIKTD